MWQPLPSFPDLAALNAWLEERCIEQWGQIQHGALPGSIADVHAAERASLMPLGRPFDGFVEHTKRVSPIGETRETAFARILRHSVVRRAIGEGAVPVFMPKLFAAQAVEVRRLKFHDAAAGKTGRADTPLGPFDRSRVKSWLVMMDGNFAGINTWLP